MQRSFIVWCLICVLGLLTGSGEIFTPIASPVSPAGGVSVGVDPRLILLSRLSETSEAPHNCSTEPRRDGISSFANVRNSRCAMCFQTDRKLEDPGAAQHQFCLSANSSSSSGPSSRFCGLKSSAGIFARRTFCIRHKSCLRTRSKIRFSSNTSEVLWL